MPLPWRALLVAVIECFNIPALIGALPFLVKWIWPWPLVHATSFARLVSQKTLPQLAAALASLCWASCHPNYGVHGQGPRPNQAHYECWSPGLKGHHQNWPKNGRVKFPWESCWLPVSWELLKNFCFDFSGLWMSRHKLSSVQPSTLACTWQI